MYLARIPIPKINSLLEIQKINTKILAWNKTSARAWRIKGNPSVLVAGATVRLSSRQFRASVDLKIFSYKMTQHKNPVNSSNFCRKNLAKSTNFHYKIQKPGKLQ
jgi:hypothetical protein